MASGWKRFGDGVAIWYLIIDLGRNSLLSMFPKLTLPLSLLLSRPSEPLPELYVFIQTLEFYGSMLTQI